jgi:magnesium transporter
MTLNTVVSSSLIEEYFQKYPGEAANLLTTFSADDILSYLASQPILVSAELYSRLNPEVAAELISKMPDELFTRIFEKIDASLAARLISRLNEEQQKKQLNLLSASCRKELQELIAYPPETAGYLMDTRIATFSPDDTVEWVLNKIRSIKDRRILNINVIEQDGTLRAVIPLQEVAVCDAGEQLKNINYSKLITIQALAPREEVVELLEEQKLLSMPVVDFDGKLLGIIRYDALLKAAKQDVTEDVQAMFGAGRDEQALSKASFAIRKRLPWLEINLATAFLASAVVGMFEDTIARITVLAVFLPVVAGQSGNTGSQALAVTMRGLALREIRGRHWFRVAKKEMLVGFVNGCVVALTTSAIVYLWESSLGLSLVIAIAMVISMVIAGLSGAVIPIILKTFGQDPAQSSSIILTTVTDVVGFMSFLGLATILAHTFNIV